MKPISLKRILAKAVGLVFPDICPVCGRTLVEGETTMCLHCRSALPTVNCHPFNDNSLHRHLASTVPIEQAASMFVYRRGDIYVKLIHAAKYNGRPLLARQLAREFATQLSRQNFFATIDTIVPVPLHWWKQIRRGYNQSEAIARGIADVTGLPVVSDAMSAASHSSQTRHSRSERWQNASAVYVCNRQLPPSANHILLVDDVITSGATMLACCHALHNRYPYLQISILSLAATSSI